MADLADQLAASFEAAATRGDADRRRRIAALEREVARIQRRNAARLRQAGGEPVQLERLPRDPAGGIRPGRPAGSRRDSGPAKNRP
jgi:hypothetical protein